MNKRKVKAIVVKNIITGQKQMIARNPKPNYKKTRRLA